MMIPCVLVLSQLASGLAFQKPGGRDTGVPAPSSIPRRRPSPRRSPPSIPTKVAAVTLIVSPPDSMVWLGTERVDGSRASDGTIRLTNLKPDYYSLMVRHAGYGDSQQTITLEAGDNDPVLVSLEPLKGTLTVKPSVDGTSIEVRSLDRNQIVGSYAGSIDQIGFPVGEYEITVSKPGYQVTTRRFVIKSAGSVDLEPRIDAIPTPTPTPRTVIASRSTVSANGKYTEVNIWGTAGDPARTGGIIDVTVNRLSSTAYVQGALNGLPCQISLANFENVAEWVVVDNPRAENDWAMVAVRLRPKDNKQLIRFTITWTVTTGSPVATPQDQSNIATKAVPIHRVVPVVPALARSSRTKGVVKVSVQVDANGTVISAKAFDGAVMLRQAAEDAARGWRFKPATRNGIPVPSTEVIHFIFEGY